MPPTTPFGPAPAPSALQIQMAGGVNVALPNDLDRITPFVLIEQEDWFEKEIGFVRRLAGDGFCMVDIGANFGLYTLAAASASGNSAHILAIEPASSTANWLRESIALNGMSGITVAQMAVSDHEGDGFLTIDKHPELNSLSENAAPGAETEQVALTTLDKLAAEHFPERSVDFLKLDAEGAELAIIEGGTRFFEAQHPLVMFELKHRHSVNYALVERFQALGYAPFLLMPGLDLLVPFTGEHQIDNFSLNLFSCKPERAALLKARGLLVDDTDGTAPEPPAWQALADNQPWITRAHPDWLAWGETARSQPEEEQLRLALLHWLGSCGESDQAERARARFLHLKEAERLILSHPGLNAHGDRRRAGLLMIGSRISGALGLQQRQQQMLRDAIATLAGGGDFMTTPHLAPNPRFDAIDPGGQLPGWLSVAITEMICNTHQYTSLFAKEADNRTMLGQLIQSPFLAPVTARRFALMLIRTGETSGPAFARALEHLRKPAPGNLNAALWQQYS
jgi:FkbM family methyltransferase